MLAGKMPENDTEIVLLVDTKNRINNTIMKELGFDTQADSVDFSEVIGTELKVILNDDYYITTEYGTYTFNTDYKAMYESETA